MGKVVFDEGLEEFEFDFNNYGEATLSQQFSNLAAYWITWGYFKDTDGRVSDLIVLDATQAC